MSKPKQTLKRKHRACAVPLLGAPGDCRFIHDVPNAAHDGHDCERLIFPDALCEASLSRKALRPALRFREGVHGRQHEVIEKPT